MIKLQEQEKQHFSTLLSSDQVSLYHTVSYYNVPVRIYQGRIQDFSVGDAIFVRGSILAYNVENSTILKASQ